MKDSLEPGFRDPNPCRVIGVTQKRENGFGNNSALNVWVPYTTAMRRLVGQNYLRNITVRISDSANPSAAEQGITKLMTQRHASKDFFVRNSDSIRQTIESTTQTLTLLISSIAVISLIVGDPQPAVAAALACRERGVLVGCFRPPSVEPGTSRLRLTVRADLDDATLDHVGDVVLAALREVGAQIR